MEKTLHPCEPNLEELKKIRASLYTQESTGENLKKIKAVEKQIERHEQHNKKE